MLNYDFIIHPSRFESFGYVPVEAMALKIPVIVSSVGGLKEVVEEDSGYISYDNSPESYFLILKHLYEGDPDLQKKIDCAFSRVKKEFSKETMLKKIEDIFFS